MLGFGAVGQLALGQIALSQMSQAPASPGHGSGNRFFFVPGPAYDAKPNKPFRPVWDQPPQGEVERPKVARPVPLPPASLFARPPVAPPPPITAAPPFGLPDFNNVIPPDPMGLASRMRETTDVSDAMTALTALIEGLESVN